jgi:hypothetical protein
MTTTTIPQAPELGGPPTSPSPVRTRAPSASRSPSDSGCDGFPAWGFVWILSHGRLRRAPVGDEKWLAAAQTFKSSLGHNDVWLADYIESLLTRTFVLVGCGLWWTEVALSGHSFPTYPPRRAVCGERSPSRARPPMSTGQPCRPLRGVTGGPLHG